MLRNLLQGAGLLTVMSLALAGCKPAQRIEVLSGPTMGSTLIPSSMCLLMEHPLPLQRVLPFRPYWMRWTNKCPFTVPILI